jgi:hypothetical protein
MEEKFASNRIPRTDEALDLLTQTLEDYATPHIEGGGGISPDWTDISLAHWANFKTAHAVWKVIYAVCKKPHLPKDTQAKKTAKAALCDALNVLINRGLLLAPRTPEDVVAMGFSLIDNTPTDTTKVNDTVAFGNMTSGTVLGSHVHIVPYNITGSTSRSKAPYHLAVFQVCIRDRGESAPRLKDKTGWSNDHISMKTPFEYEHDAADVGKIAYYRACWEANSGAKGKWTMTSGEID